MRQQKQWRCLPRTSLTAAGRDGREIGFSLTCLVPISVREPIKIPDKTEQPAKRNKLPPSVPALECEA